jgi:hypothetical protein
MFHLVRKDRCTIKESFNFFVGFEHNSDALAAAEIEQKMAEFELEPIITNEQQEDVDDDQ